jgi:hypothetical protein
MGPIGLEPMTLCLKGKRGPANTNAAPDSRLDALPTVTLRAFL